jgi:hypothetical protein
MVAKSPEVIFHLARDGLEECVVSRICATSEHKVMPDQDPQLVAYFVENVFFVHPTTPHTESCQLYAFDPGGVGEGSRVLPNASLISLDKHVEQSSISLMRDARQEMVCRAPV